MSSILKNRGALGLEFLRVSKLTELTQLGLLAATNYVDHRFLDDLREGLAKQGVHIDVTRFDFAYIKEIIVALVVPSIIDTIMHTQQR